MGVRRVGRTVLARSIPDAEHLDFELPLTRALVADPEGLLQSVKGRTVVMDEIHRLPNSAELLTVAAATSRASGFSRRAPQPLKRRAAFRRLFELLMAQSGSIFAATRFAKPVEHNIRVGARPRPGLPGDQRTSRAAWM